MRRTVFVSIVCLLWAATSLWAQPTAQPNEPFKLGTFELQGERFLGLVLRDAFVVDLDRANRAFQRSPLVVELPMAQDMKELAGRYDLDLKERIYGIVNQLLSEDRLIGTNRRPMFTI